MSSTLTASSRPVALTVAGSDSGGGAGIQADLRTFAACGVFGTSAITCLTAQNPAGVTAVAALEPAFVRAQLDAVESYFHPAARKTGMLFNAAIIGAVADFLEAWPAAPTVVDPVMVATSGAVLLQPEAIAALRQRLLPRATVVTPNLDEAQVLLGSRPSNREEMVAAARELVRRFGCAFLLKGGHLETAELVDILATPDGRMEQFAHPRVDGVNSHGSGCTLSAALAAGLARGLDLPRAVAEALEALQAAFQAPVILDGQAFLGTPRR